MRRRDALQPLQSGVEGALAFPSRLRDDSDSPQTAGVVAWIEDPFGLDGDLTLPPVPLDGFSLSGQDFTNAGSGISNSGTLKINSTGGGTVLTI